MGREPPFWFPAKKYGWGWGLPVRWQGWLVLAVYAALLLGGVGYFLPRNAVAGFVLYAAVVTALLVVVTAIKGERPLRWRWGKE